MALLRGPGKRSDPLPLLKDTFSFIKKFARGKCILPEGEGLSVREDEEYPVCRL